MKKIYLKIIAILGLGISLGMTILLFITFLAAWFNGNEILVTINSFGEAKVEIILFPIFIALGFYGLYSAFKSLLINRRTSNEIQ
jgi:hypothetical protein